MRSLALPSTEPGDAVESVASYESVRLFVERARTTQPQSRLADQNVAAVVQICNRLKRGRAFATGGFVVWSLHQFEAATAYLEESIAITEQFGDTLTLVQARRSSSSTLSNTRRGPPSLNIL